MLVALFTSSILLAALLIAVGCIKIPPLIDRNTIKRMEKKRRKELEKRLAAIEAERSKKSSKPDPKLEKFEREFASKVARRSASSIDAREDERSDVIALRTARSKEELGAIQLVKRRQAQFWDPFFHVIRGVADAVPKRNKKKARSNSESDDDEDDDTMAGVKSLVADQSSPRRHHIGTPITQNPRVDRDAKAAKKSHVVDAIRQRHQHHHGQKPKPPAEVAPPNSSLAPKTGHHPMTAVVPTIPEESADPLSTASTSCLEVATPAGGGEGGYGSERSDRPPNSRRKTLSSSGSSGGGTSGSMTLRPPASASTDTLRSVESLPEATATARASPKKTSDRTMKLSKESGSSETKNGAGKEEPSSEYCQMKDPPLYGTSAQPASVGGPRTGPESITVLPGLAAMMSEQDAVNDNMLHTPPVQH